MLKLQNIVVSNLINVLLINKTNSNFKCFIPWIDIRRVIVILVFKKIQKV